MLFSHSNSFTPIAGFRNNLYVFLKEQKLLDLIACIDDIVNDHHTNGITFTHGVTPLSCLVRLLHQAIDLTEPDTIEISAGTARRASHENYTARILYIRTNLST
jgi:hypothetical protein